MLFQGRKLRGKLRGIQGSVCVQLPVWPAEVDSPGDGEGCQVTIWLLCISMISGKHSVFGQPQRISGSQRVVAEWSQSGRRVVAELRRKG